MPYHYLRNQYPLTMDETQNQKVKTSAVSQEKITDDELSIELIEQMIYKFNRYGSEKQLQEHRYSQNTAIENYWTLAGHAAKVNKPIPSYNLQKIYNAATSSNITLLRKLLKGKKDLKPIIKDMNIEMLPTFLLSTAINSAQFKNILHGALEEFGKEKLISYIDKIQFYHLPLLLICNNINSMKLLVEMGANPNVTNVMGNNPLHLIAKKSFVSDKTCIKHCNTAIFLIREGASLSQKNKAGYTPIELVDHNNKLNNVVKQQLKAAFTNAEAINNSGDLSNISIYALPKTQEFKKINQEDLKKQQQGFIQDNQAIINQDDETAMKDEENNEPGYHEKLLQMVLLQSNAIEAQYKTQHYTADFVEYNALAGITNPTGTTADANQYTSYFDL